MQAITEGAESNTRPKEYESIAEVAERLGCSKRFVAHLTETGLLKASKLGRRIFIHRGAVDQLMASNLRTK